MPTTLQLEQAMMAAHAAGDTDAARLLAGEISKTTGPDFIDRSAQTIKEGVSGAWSSAMGNDEQENYSPVPGVSGDNLSAIGKLAGTAGEVIGDAVLTAGKAVLPPEAQAWVGDKFSSVMESAPVQAVGEGIAAVDEVATKVAPQETKSVKDLGAFLAMAAPAPIKLLKGGRGHWYDDLYNNWEKKSRRTRTKHLLEPDQGDLLNNGKLKESPLRTTTWEPDARNQAVIDEVARVKGVNPNRSYVHNLNAVADTVTRMRESLDATLAKLPAIKLKGGQNFYQRVDDLAQRLDGMPTMDSSAKDEVLKIYAIFRDKMNKKLNADGSINPKDLMQLRRDLDKELIDFRPSIMDPTNVNAQKVANRELRTLINDTVAEHAGGNVDVISSLKRQSNLLTSLERLGPRAEMQSRNVFGRLLENIERSTGLKHPTTPVAVGTAATNPLVATGTALSAFLVGGGQTINRTARKAIQLGIASGDILLGEADKLAVLAALEKMDKDEKQKRGTFVEASMPRYEERLYQTPYPRIANEDGSYSTHKMAAEVDENGNWYAFPLIQEIDGKLEELSPQRAMAKAIRDGNLKRFGAEKEAALEYAKGGYKKGTVIEARGPA